MTQITDAYVGRGPVEAIYAGRDLVWRREPEPEPGPVGPLAGTLGGSMYFPGESACTVKIAPADHAKWLRVKARTPVKIGGESLYVEKVSPTVTPAEVDVTVMGRFRQKHRAGEPVTVE